MTSISTTKKNPINCENYSDFGEGRNHKFCLTVSTFNIDSDAFGKDYDYAVNHRGNINIPDIPQVVTMKIIT